jgi:S1-C subfamily serine protease
MGSGQPAPLHDSLAIVRSAESNGITGAALVVDSAGYLLTTSDAVSRRATVELADGTMLRPVRLASDETTGLVLLKVAAQYIDSIRISATPANAGQAVYAVGYEQVHGALGQMSGHVSQDTPESSDDDSALIETDIPFVAGFAGGALSDETGAINGLVLAPQNGTDRLCAVSIQYALDWIAQWRATVDDVNAQSSGWPTLATPAGLSLRYPSAWSVASRSGAETSFSAEIVPNERDATAGLSLSIQPSRFAGDPLEFATQEFGGRKDAVIWGTIEQSGMRGVLIRLEQEGARVDLAYLFTGQRRIALSLTSAVSMADTGSQAQQATALFNAILNSLAYTGG